MRHPLWSSHACRCDDLETHASGHCHQQGPPSTPPCAGYGRQGWARLPLFASAATGERVTMEWWAPGMRREFCPDVLSGVELFVVSGWLWPQTWLPFTLRCHTIPVVELQPLSPCPSISPCALNSPQTQDVEPILLKTCIGALRAIQLARTIHICKCRGHARFRIYLTGYCTEWVQLISMTRVPRRRAQLQRVGVRTVVMVPHSASGELGRC